MDLRALRLIGALVALVAIAAPGPAGARQVAASGSIYQQINALQKDGRYEEARVLVTSALASQSQDPKLHYALGLLLLRDGRVDEARTQLARLQALPGPYAARLEGVLDTDASQRRAQQDLASRLRALDADGALALVGGLAGSDDDRELIRAHIDLYGARFVSATSRALALQARGGLAQTSARALVEQSRAASRQFAETADRLKWFLDAPLGLGACTPDQARQSALSAGFALPEYVQLASTAFQANPLNPWLMDLAFHATLISAPYADVERLGDLILGAKGAIRVPFFSRTSRFWLVIDRRKGRLRTEAMTPRADNPAGTDALTPATPFDLAFGDIRELRQRVEVDGVLRTLEPGTAALQVEPAGVAPYYAFMPLLQCFYGEAAQKTVTYNLGAFVRHAVGRADLRARLIDPSSATRDWLGAVSTALAVSTAAAEVSVTMRDNVRTGANDSAGFKKSLDSAQAMVTKGLADDRARDRSIADAQSASRRVYFDSATSHVRDVLAQVTSDLAFREIAALGQPSTTTAR